MKYLVAIPVWRGVDHTKECIDSAIKENSEVFIIDNDAEPGIKEYIYKYDPSKVDILTNHINTYVNPAWNVAMTRFLHIKTDFDYLILLNSDAVLPPNWNDVLDFYLQDNPKSIPVPEFINDKTKLGHIHGNTLHQNYITGGIAGICIILSRKMVESVFPIPYDLKLWFGDNYIYDMLRKKWYSTFILHGFHVYHAISQNVSRLPEAESIIQQDKHNWEIIKQKYDL